MSEYRVNLEIFAGPMDLLLYLVRKEEVDIYDIPIARITEQYVGYLEMLKELDIDVAGDFLVLAATLMEIKSIMLLPRTEAGDVDSEDSEDPRAELVRQLLEYKRFKDAANMLDEAAQERKLRHTRPDSILSSLKPDAEPELDLDQVSIWTLLEAFDSILKATGHGGGYEHIHDDTPIDLYQIEILHRLQEEGPMSFERIFENRNNRLVMIGLFLAMLELIRNHLIWIEQPGGQGPIHLKPLTQEQAEQAVQRAIYVNEEEPEAAEEETRSNEPQFPEDLIDEAEKVGELGKEAVLHEAESVRSRIPIQEIDTKDPVTEETIPGSMSAEAGSGEAEVHKDN